MPHYTVTAEWSNPIAVTAGDIVQLEGSAAILVCPVTPAADGDAVRLEPRDPGFAIDKATQIRVRAASWHRATFKIVRGL